MKKLLATMLASAMAFSTVGGLVACGNDDDGGNTIELPSQAELVVWCSDGAKSCYEGLLQTFKKENPVAKDWSVTFEGKGEGDTLAALQTDITTAADIFFFASDHINTMMENEFLQPLIAPFDTRVKSRDSEGAIDPITKDGSIYGYPNVNSNGYFLIYDTEVFSEEDIKSLDTMVTKAKAANKKILYDYGTGFYAPTFFFGMDVGLGDTSSDYKVEVNTPKGIAASSAYVKYFGEGKDGSFVMGTGNNSIAVGLGSGELCAGVMGTWVNENGYMDKLLEEKGWPESRIGYAKLPTFTVEGQGEFDGTYQMGSFMGAKYCGVNPTKSESTILASLALADWFNNEAGQIARFNATQEAPTNKNASNNENVKANKMLAALVAQNDAGGRAQLITPPQFWESLETFTKSIYAKTTTMANLSTAVQTLDAGLKKTE